MLRIGIDLGGTKIEGIVMDNKGGILCRERRPTPAAQGYEAILTGIGDLVHDLERQAKEPCRIGIGTPGAISTRTGALKNSNTACLIGKPILKDLEKRLERPVRMANDANCFTLSEALDGAGKDHAAVFGVIMGTGVGGGIVFNGKLHEGPQHIAGEWGHNVLEADGPACYCGKRGCVETFLSGPGLARDYRSLAGDPALEAHAIVARAQEGDALAEEAMQRYLDRFGRALAGVINILDPDVVVLGGGMSNIERLYTEGRERVARYVFAAHGCANVGRFQPPASRDTRTSLYIAGDTTPGMEDDCRDAGGRVTQDAVTEVEQRRDAHRDVGGRVASGTKTEQLPRMPYRDVPMPRAQDAQERRSGATNDDLKTPILPNTHGDSSGVRGAAQLWPPAE